MQHRIVLHSQVLHNDKYRHQLFLLRSFIFTCLFSLYSDLNLELSQHVVDAGAVPLLVLCIQEPEITLKRISASSLGDICKHSPELAQVRSLSLVLP